MQSLHRPQRIAIKPATTIAAAVLLLLFGIIAMAYQVHSARSERLRQLTAQANTLAASITAAIAFNDRSAAQEYVHALMLDPRIDAVAIYDESGRLFAGGRRSGSVPITDPAAGGLPVDGEAAHLLRVEVPARQGATPIGSVWLRSAAMPVMVQLARFSGVGLLTIMAVLMLSFMAVAQRALARANADVHARAEQLAAANAQLLEEMEQRSRAEEALRQSQKMEAVGQLSGGIAHDFNNVLMVVKTALTLLEKRLSQGDAAAERFVGAARARIAAGGGQDAAAPLEVLESGLELMEQRSARKQQIRRYLETAHEGIDKAANLTRRLLGFARQQPLAPTSLRLDALVRGMQALLEHSVGSDIRIQYQLASNWHVSCDANQMENAILNLVINARDAMPNGGEITISTADTPADAVENVGEVAGERVCLRVSDAGVGMNEDVRRRAGDPFFTTKPVGQGTGLGLSTIMGYVAQSNGQLEIHSEEGVGTTIEIMLPRDLSSIPRQVA